MLATFERFTLTMTTAQADDCSRPGQDATDAVKYLVNQPHIRRQLAKITDADLVAELRGYGAWSAEELTNRADNEQRIIWTAACNIREETRTPCNQDIAKC